MPLPNYQQRRERLEKILEPICSLDSFTSREIQLACHEMSSGFVTKILKQLADEGVLELADGKKRSFRWHAQRGTFIPSAWIEKKLGTQIQAAPTEDRPRERLLNQGPEKLRVAELLAILIRVGRQGESALEGGERIANRFAENLGKLREQGPTELKRISSVVSTAVFCQIMAGIELGRRVVDALESKEDDPTKIDSTAAAVEYCHRRFRRLAVDRRQEEFHVVTLDTKLFPIAHHQVTVGTLDASLVHPREVFKPAIRDSASAILLVHNHPSGDPTPSREDFLVTDRLKKSAEILGIRVLDHIVVASEYSVSIMEWESQRGRSW